MEAPGERSLWDLLAQRAGLSSVPGPLEARPCSHTTRHHSGHTTDPLTLHAGWYQSVFIE